MLRLTRIRGTGAGTAALGTPCQTTPVWRSRRRAAHRVEIPTGGDDLQRRRVFGTKRIDAAQPKKPAERTRGHVLDPSIEAVHEDDRRDARRHDLGDPADQNHVNDDGIDAVTPRGLHGALAEAPVRCDSGEVSHDGSE